MVEDICLFQNPWLDHFYILPLFAITESITYFFYFEFETAKSDYLLQVSGKVKKS